MQGFEVARRIVATLQEYDEDLAQGSLVWVKRATALHSVKAFSVHTMEPMFEDVCMKFAFLHESIGACLKFRAGLKFRACFHEDCIFAVVHESDIRACLKFRTSEA